MSSERASLALETPQAASLDTLVEEDEESTELTRTLCDSRTPVPSQHYNDPDASADRSGSLRPLRLSAVNTSGASLLGSSPAHPQGTPSSAAKARRRVSSIMYKPSPPVTQSATFSKDADSPVGALSDSPIAEKNWPLFTHRTTTQSGQSSNTSWPATDTAASEIFSLHSSATESNGGTSVESADDTPRRGKSTDTVSPSSDTVFPALHSHSLQHQVDELQLQMQIQYERHLRDVSERQRELEDVRRVTAAELVHVVNALDAANKRNADMEREHSGLRDALEEAAGERDMLREDVTDWRTRCSGLEKTIQSQQLRLKQELTWRKAATKRMDVLSERVQSYGGAVSFDWQPPTGDDSMHSSTGSNTSTASSTSMGSADVLPDLPTMPSEEEQSGWSQRIARQLSKHSPHESTSSGDLDAATVHLLSDMRQQIMALYSELRLEQSNHEQTRTELRDMRAAQHAVEPVSDELFLGASLRIDDDGTTPALMSTPRVKTGYSDAAVAQRGSAGESNGEAAYGAFVLDIPGNDADGDTSASTFDSSTTADVLFPPEPSTGSDDALVGLGLVPPHTPSPQLHPSSLEDAPTPRAGERQSQSMEDPVIPGRISVDLEAGGVDDSTWVSDADDVEKEQNDDDAEPRAARPEFIPEWSFAQASFEAAQDVRVYEVAGRRRVCKQSRRGAQRTKEAPAEDFFGIMSSGALLPPLPVPDYALDVPPIGAAGMPLAKRSSKLARSPYRDGINAESPKPVLRTPSARNKADTLVPMVPMVSNMLAQWSPWGASDDTPVMDTGADASYASRPCTPIPDELCSARLAPPIPAPRTPIPRSPEVDASPRGTGLRYVKPNPQKRIPVPAPVWTLNFTPTTATAMADIPFMI
ncbi:hypothetical protein MSPP1_001198 [Malassezia sp. CBS 17886]|nr:hypothetical protein MSPP1_001198 [Malassezia sp. CBS 17886]